jgi:LysR family transcriptional regulator, low CO2-responsive transcriptional regulator
MKEATLRRDKHLTRPRLRALVAVTDAGSFAAAARRLGISHTSVAQQIHELEQEQGVHLFDRIGRKLCPTPLCDELYDIGQRIVSAELDAERLLSRCDVHGRRFLRVGLGNAMPGMALIAQVIRDVPNLSVSVITGSHQRIMQAVASREIDVAILPDVPGDPRFRIAPLVSQEVVAIIHPDHPLSRRATVRLDELAEQPLIFRSRGSSTQRLVDRAMRTAGLDPVPILTADTRDGVAEAVALGIGIGFMWRLGTSRTDMFRCLVETELAQASQEVVFAQADERNVVIDLFFGTAERFVIHRSGRVPASGQGPSRA